MEEKLLEDEWAARRLEGWVSGAVEVEVVAGRRASTAGEEGKEGGRVFDGFSTCDAAVRAWLNDVGGGTRGTAERGEGPARGATAGGSSPSEISMSEEAGETAAA
jgi:hypothetical protein